MYDSPEAMIAARRRRTWKVLALVLGVPALIVSLSWWWLFWMPGRSFEGPLPALSTSQAKWSAALKRDVVHLSQTIGIRDVRRPKALLAAQRWIEARFRSLGYTPTLETYDTNGQKVSNVIAVHPKSPAKEPIVVVGAHYDSTHHTPGANDNASGTAVLLALAEIFRPSGSLPVLFRRRLRFVAFTNEEPPHFQTEKMGSWVHAMASKKRGDAIVAMLSLETMGYYSDEAKSQRYPPPFSAFYPDKGNFIAFVGNFGSRALVHRVIRCFRRKAKFPSQGITASSMVPGIGWSDHWSFWQAGYPALMVTDTAIFRDRSYHTMRDTPEHLNYDRLARVVEGLRDVIVELVSGE